MPTLYRLRAKLPELPQTLVPVLCLVVISIFGLAYTITDHPSLQHTNNRTTQELQPTALGISSAAKSQQYIATSNAAPSSDQTGAATSTVPKNTAPRPYGTPSTGTQAGTTVPTMAGNPSFQLILGPPGTANNPFGFAITIIPGPSPVDYSYTTPKVVATPNGLPCNSWDNAVYNIGNDRLTWGWSCNIFSGASYGNYPVTFSSTATGGYGETATVMVTGTVVYRAEQTTYENTF